ncbi:MAG TPA: hypothetical protein VFB15_11580 [Candidatus Binataceae bacterium]|nr:hypothetical protein [Candidatus Binataceae bacterium]
MRLEIYRDHLAIIPESTPDELYIENVLGLTQDGDSTPLTLVALQADGGMTMVRLEARHA